MGRERKMGRERSMSFMTAALARGGFPTSHQIPSFPLCGVFGFDELPDAGLLRIELKKMLVKYERFRSVPNVKNLKFDEVVVNLDEHLFEAEVDSEEAVDEYINNFLTEALPHTKPLWDIHFIKNTSGQSSMLFRVDHAIGDGISLVNFIYSLATDTNGNPATPPVFTRPAGKSRKGFGAKVVATLVMAKKVLLAIVKCLGLAVGPGDSKSVIFGSSPFQYSARHKMITSPAFDLTLVREAKAGLAATVNDVISCCLAGAFRRYMEHREDPVLGQPGLKLRALLPYAFPKRSKLLSNRWCFISLGLPVEVPQEEPLLRLRRVKASLDALKASPEAYVQMHLQTAAASVLSADMQKQTALDAMSRHSVVFTNVPGPPQKLAFCGQVCQDMRVYVANIRTQAAVLSYAGKVRFTMVVDDAVVTEPHLLVRFFMEELNVLHHAATNGNAAAQE